MSGITLKRLHWGWQGKNLYVNAKENYNCSNKYKVEIVKGCAAVFSLKQKKIRGFLCKNINILYSCASAGGKTSISPWQLGLRTSKAFYKRPFPLKPEKDNKRVDAALPGKNPANPHGSITNQ